jgi:hypothetical protein
LKMLPHTLNDARPIFHGFSASVTAQPINASRTRYQPVYFLD